ncbi:MAG TPA: DNA methyltransferase [Syntrophorhabdaceae bacterium]|nr:DNA methyltransferase [Syntrophorhabdaceae bacterium]
MITNRKGEIMLERAEDISPFWAYDFSYSKDADLTLLDNVQFIYELSLAELELNALGADYEVTNGLREFKLNNKSNELNERIIKKSSYFKSVGKNFTDYFQIIQKNRTRSVNQYLTHWIYPYKGKFHPQMIRALLNIIGLKEGDTVFEPFSGSGTTALEAQLLGINFIGIDVSPLCVLQGKVKTKSIYAIDEIIKLKNTLISKLRPSLFNQESDFYKVLESIDNKDVRDFYTLARLLAVSDESRRGRNFEQSFIKNLNLMIDSVRDYKEIVEKLHLKLGDIDIKIGDSRKVDLPDNSIDGIITSPPYSIALDYVENDAHSLEDMGYKLKEIREDFIGVRGKGKDRVELYNNDMRKSYDEMYRILKPNKYAVIVIGNATYQGQEVKTVEFTIDYMTELGFNLEKNILKLIFGLYNVMKKENILIFRKVK